MNNDFLEKRLKELSKLNFFNDLVINRGIEKEFFRVNHKGDISEREHPQSLGSALTNKFITTDFAEDLGYKYAFAWAKPGVLLDKYKNAEYTVDKTPSYELILKY